jgi:hypothetical protein
VTGPASSHSKTVHERASAEVTLSPDSHQASARHPIRADCDPGAEGRLIRWHTIATGKLSAGSTYSIAFAWRFPGQRNLRAVFTGDRRNTRGVSAVSTVIVEQTEIPSFTISSSDPVVPDQTPVTISGRLLTPSSNAPEGGVSVALYAGPPRRDAWAETQATTTAADGSYGFTGQGSASRLYHASTTFAPARHSAVVFQGVQDVVSITPSSTAALVGERVTLRGNVAPGKPGAAVYLERLGRTEAGTSSRARSSTAPRTSDRLDVRDPGRQAGSRPSAG